jgi:predicted DNA-binding transcriptional regulator AlpA
MTPQSTAPGRTGPVLPSQFLINCRELSRLLGRSRASIARDVAARRVPPPVRIGRATRWRLSEIELWIAAGCPPRERLAAHGEIGSGNGPAGVPVG